MPFVRFFMLLCLIGACASPVTDVNDVEADVSAADVTAPVDTLVAGDPDAAAVDTGSALEDAVSPPNDTQVAPQDSSQTPDTAMAPDTTVMVDTQSPSGDVSPDGSGTVTLAFRHMDKGWSAPLSFNQTGTNTAGEPFTYDFLRYWVTNVSFKRSDGTSYDVPASYYLVEETPQNTRLDVSISGVPEGEYVALTFGIGVDKAHNASLDLMEGELSVDVGMSWNWNTGYIFFKVEGTLGADAKKFKMHVGTDETYRVVTREFAEPVLIGADNPVKIWLRADLSRLFDNLPPGPYFFSISPLATTVADNYATWFDAVEITAP